MICTIMFTLWDLLFLSKYKHVEYHLNTHVYTLLLSLYIHPEVDIHMFTDVHVYITILYVELWMLNSL